MFKVELFLHLGSLPKVYDIAMMLLNPSNWRIAHSFSVAELLGQVNWKTWMICPAFSPQQPS